MHCAGRPFRPRNRDGLWRPGEIEKVLAVASHLNHGMLPRSSQDTGNFDQRGVTSKAYAADHCFNSTMTYDAGQFAGECRRGLRLRAET